MPAVPTLSDSPDDDAPVILRGHAPSDLGDLVEQCRDPEFQRWTGVPVPYGPEEARIHLDYLREAWERGTEWSFAVEYAGRYCGTVSLKHLGGVRGELTYGTHPWARGRGLTTRALRLLLDWGFAALGLESVQWWAEVGNWASRRVAWRLGFRVEGTVRGALPHRGELRDAWVASLLRGDPREPPRAWHRPAVLSAETATLRPLAERDLPRVVEACSDRETSYWLGSLPAPYRPEDAAAWLELVRTHHAEGAAWHWVSADPVTDRLQSALSLTLPTGPDGLPELGYWTHPGARGTGQTARAARLLLDHAFTELGYDAVAALAAVDNTPSRRVLEAVGFRPVGVERRVVRLRDRFADAMRYDLLADDLHR